ncbi:T9SS type A sorting domain-containing protein, partial [bacterium]|nr:T9SS type A sorting domain-containing protein [bacterium]
GQQNFTEYCMTNYFNDAFDLWPGDFNDDGNLDIAGTAYGGDAVSVWENVPIELELILEPYFPPVQIPPQGGSFDFGLVIRNHSQFNLNFNGWIEIELPGGASIHTISLRNDMMVSANDSLVWWDMLQNVPANAPSGLYQYIAKIGTHPYSVWQQDQFQVDKTGAFVNSERDWDFTLTGWITQVENPYESLKIGEYGLITANPNPFNPTTILSYELRVAGSVLLTVYDIQGREAARLVNGWQEAGIHKVTFDGADLSSGIYFVRLQAGEFTALQKLVLLK